MNEVQAKLADLQHNGWTIAAIADEMGVSNMTVFRWKIGTRNAQNKLSVLYKLRSLLDRKRIPKLKRKGLVKKLRNSSQASRDANRITPLE